jgi:septal ring factor EnvC (AmiA/AmiB activator)
MSKQEQIEALRKEIRNKERQVYQVNKEMNAWNKAGARSLANTKMSNIYLESARKEIAELQDQLSKLQSGG